MTSVTLKDVYDIANRIETKFDIKFDDHEKRLRVQENFQTRLMAMGGIFSAFVSLAATFVWQRIFQINK